MTAPRQSLAVVAHDAGGARALLPVATELQRRGHELILLLAGPAVKIFAEAFPVTPVADAAPLELITAELQRHQVVAVLSASGLYNRLEHTTRLAAQPLGLPVVALQDAWFNQRERFERNGSASRPDVVCVMDELSLIELERAGFSPAQLVLTGHPGLEQTVQLCRAATAKQVCDRRRAFGLSADGIVLTFFSDPFFTGPGRAFYSGPGGIMRPDGAGLYGYTVRDVLPAVLMELERALREENATAEFIVRPHPSECAEVVEEIVAQHPAERLRVRVEAQGTTVEWIQMSDALLGMMTIALLQAALAGKPALSVQLGLSASGQEDPCMANTLGYTRAAFDSATLRELCRHLARRNWPALQPAPRHALQIDGSASRVADCLLRTVRLA
jgi:hypothetical protein